MTALENVSIQQAIVHKVGNPTRGEQLLLSPHPLTLNDDLVRSLLVRYLLAPFSENEIYHFTHLSDVQMNEVYRYVREIFEQPKRFVAVSQLLAKLLYSKSTHARVKDGELYVVYFENVFFEGESQPAIGIFKSETKETFLKVFAHGKGWELGAEDGININKLDKGCLVFRTESENGFRVSVVDHTNRQETQYWVNDFLQVQPLANSYQHTNQVMGLCKLFIENEYAEKFDIQRSDQIDLMNRSIDYFRTKEQFDMNEFAAEVIHHPEVVESFMQFKRNFEDNRRFEIDAQFDIHGAAVQKQQKLFKSVLKLDKNFHVYIHGRRDLIERGYDEAVGKKFYKLYYD
ncbi:MAG TPA: nucleoid-associated protein, partial [Flavihumibacter sp.]|nr:nucleoid-associated protein [Flavihumibacter sp.]